MTYTKIALAQAGSARIKATFTIKEKDSRYSSRLTTHYADIEEVNEKRANLQERYPGAEITLTTL